MNNNLVGNASVRSTEFIRLIMCAKEWGVNLSILMLLILFSSDLFAEEVYLFCNMSLNDKSTKIYSFTLNEQSKSLFLTESSQDLQIIKVNSAQLWASSDKKIYKSFEFDNQTFYFNRITGILNVSYSRKHTKEEHDECLKRPLNKQFTCDSFIVLPNDEYGKCSVVEPVF